MSGCGCSRKTCRIGPDDPRHGTYNAYGNLGCGCEQCKQANSRYCYNAKRKRQARGWGCRCEACTAAWAKAAWSMRAR